MEEKEREEWNEREKEGWGGREEKKKGLWRG